MRATQTHVSARLLAGLMIKWAARAIRRWDGWRVDGLGAGERTSRKKKRPSPKSKTKPPYRCVRSACQPQARDAEKARANGTLASFATQPLAWRAAGLARGADLRDGEVRAEAFIAEGHQPR